MGLTRPTPFTILQPSLLPFFWGGGVMVRGCKKMLLSTRCFLYDITIETDVFEADDRVSKKISSLINHSIHERFSFLFTFYPLPSCLIFCFPQGNDPSPTFTLQLRLSSPPRRSFTVLLLSPRSCFCIFSLLLFVPAFPPQFSMHSLLAALYRKTGHAAMEPYDDENDGAKGEENKKNLKY